MELCRGWGITAMRKIPFTVIQFPLWEAMKGGGGEKDEEGERAGKCCREHPVWEFGGQRGGGGNYSRWQWADMRRLKL